MISRAKLTTVLPLLDLVGNNTRLKVKAAEADKKFNEAKDAKIQADRDAKAKVRAAEEIKKLKDAKDAEKK